MNALSGQAIRILKLFGKDVDYVSTTVGPEQEYFLIKKEDYEARQDLILTGRTLFGAPSAKGQELEEHYLSLIHISKLIFLMMWPSALKIRFSLRKESGTFS